MAAKSDKDDQPTDAQDVKAAQVSDEPATPDTKEAGGDQVEEIRNEARDQGYEGTVPPGPSNEEVSLESGPDSPSALETLAQARESELDQVRQATAAGRAGKSSGGKSS